MRSLVLSLCLAAAWLTSVASQAEAAVTRSTSGPLCRLAASCAASSWRVGAMLGGNDQLLDYVALNPHLCACVRDSAGRGRPPGDASSPSTAGSDVGFFAHLLFDY